MKAVNTQNLGTFGLGTQEGVNVPISIIIEFQQTRRQHSQNMNNGTFCWSPVTTAQCLIPTEKYLDARILLNNNDDDYSQGFGQIKEVFKALTKDDMLKPYISVNDCRSSNDCDDIVYNLYVFDIRF